MATEGLLAIIGILATVSLGIWAIILTVRYNRRVRVTYAHEDTIALTDDITQNFPDLKIAFRDQPVSDNLVLLKGYFLNTGRRDISRDMVEEQITMTLPDDFEWVDCKVVNSSPSLKAVVNKTSKTSVSFDTGLWKTREYLKFEALAKVPVVKTDFNNPPPEHPTFRLRKAISLCHRIADSKTIYEVRVPSAPSKLSSTRTAVLLGHLLVSNKFDLILGGATILLGLAFSISAHLLSNPVLGISVVIDGQARSVVQSLKDDIIVLSDDSGFEKKYTLAEFNVIPNKLPCIIHKTNKEFAAIGYIYVALGLIVLVLFGWRRIREARLLALIASKSRP